MSGLQSEFANEFALRPAVAFAKRMSGVQFAAIVGGAAGKGVGGKVHKMVFGRQFRHDLLERGFQERSKSEQMTTLGYVHCPKRTSPLVYVLEDGPMDGFQMGPPLSARSQVVLIDPLDFRTAEDSQVQARRYPPARTSEKRVRTRHNMSHSNCEI